jgi:DNA-binding transcriptional LysR family regulator
MFEWDDARHFLAIHRKGSLSAAARQLGVNQSTVGRRLLVLEERLGTKLFIRTRDGYRIGPAGERLLPHAERMEDEATAIAREITGQVTSLTGTVRVTSADLFGPRIVAPLLVRFHERYPDIELELDADYRRRSLSKREADMAVRVGGVPEGGLAVRKVGLLACTAYASRAYVERRGRPRDGAWDGHDFIAFSDPMTGLEESRWIEGRAARGRVVFRTFNTLAQVALAVAGLGVAILPCYAADEEPELVRLVPPSKAVVYPIWLAVHQDMRNAARIRACSDFLAEGLRAQSARLRGERAPASRAPSRPAPPSPPRRARPAAR